MRDHKDPKMVSPSRTSFSLVCLCDRDHRYSFNALLGSLEGEGLLGGALEVELVGDERRLLEACQRLEGERRPFGVAVSAFSTEAFDRYQLISSLRAGFKWAVVMVGGPHATALPESVLRAGAHLAMVGEGERSFPWALRGLWEALNLEPVGSADELVLKAFGGAREVVGGELAGEAIDLDAHLPVSFSLGRFGPIEITRGCPYGCAFCQTSYMFGRRVRHRSVEFICDLVSRMASRGLRDFRFITPNALSYGSSDGVRVNLEALERLLSSLREACKGGRIFFGSFPSEVRPDQISPEVLALLRRFADNRRLVMGAQSGSARMLARCRRGHTADAVVEAVALARDFGFEVWVDFIFGLPGEEEDDARETLRLMRLLSSMGAKLHAHAFMPLPQTPFERESLSPIPPALLREVDLLTSRGMAFGQWRRQMELSRKLSKFLKEENCPSVGVRVEAVAPGPRPY